jgi:NADH:ubiquinone oxidoreductase subunit E
MAVMEAGSQEKLETIYSRYVEHQGSVTTVLQDIQGEFGYIPEETVHWFAKRSAIPVSRFFGVATFYKQFFLKPRGKNIITACCGTVCHVKGSDRVITRLQEELKLKKGEDTTADMQFTLETINCLGVCSVAPVVIINQKVHGQMTPDKMSKKLSEYREKESE